MAKAVLISIRPQWVEKILSGEKTVEIRKSVPKLKTPFKCYIYCTKAKAGKSHQYDAFGVNGKPVECGGKVVAEFICDEIKYHGKEGLIVKEDAERALAGSCLTRKQIIDYLGGKNTDYAYDSNRFNFCGWHISDLKVYDKPKELCEFTKYSENDIRPCEHYGECKYEYYDYSEDCRACGIDFDGENCPFIKLQRPPQSWCYVEDSQ